MIFVFCEVLTRFRLVRLYFILTSIINFCVQCLVEPCQLRFLQGADLSTDKIVVMSACGQVQLVDILDVDNTKLDVFQLDTQGEILTCSTSDQFVSLQEE